MMFGLRLWCCCNQPPNVASLWEMQNGVDVYETQGGLPYEMESTP